MRDKKKLMKNVQISMIKNNQSKGEMFVQRCRQTGDNHKESVLERT